MRLIHLRPGRLFSANVGPEEHDLARLRKSVLVNELYRDVTDLLDVFCEEVVAELRYLGKCLERSRLNGLVID